MWPYTPKKIELTQCNCGALLFLVQFAYLHNIILLYLSSKLAMHIHVYILYKHDLWRLFLFYSILSILLVNDLM
jgi:hypothetical protein